VNVSDFIEGCTIIVLTICRDGVAEGGTSAEVFAANPEVVQDGLSIWGPVTQADVQGPVDAKVFEYGICWDTLYKPVV
jgi:hypothetical protein